MRIVQPIEIVTIALSVIAPIALWLFQHDIVTCLLTSTLFLLVTLVLISCRIVSYLIAFLAEIAPSVSVIKDFMRRLS